MSGPTCAFDRECPEGYCVDKTCTTTGYGSAIMYCSGGSSSPNCVTTCQIGDTCKPGDVCCGLSENDASFCVDITGTLTKPDECADDMGPSTTCQTMGKNATVIKWTRTDPQGAIALTGGLIIQKSDVDYSGYMDEFCPKMAD